jgi:ubiquitin-protein ligase
MTVRDQRLSNDYQALKKLCAFNEPVRIQILPQSNPPEYYRLKLSNCKGIESVSGDTPKYRTEHIIVISDFPANYPDPGNLPNVIIETSIYHPNVYSSGKICFEGYDKTKINQPLDFLVKRIISMIQYDHNLSIIGNPANRDARNWAHRNQHLFPLSAN